MARFLVKCRRRRVGPSSVMETNYWLRSRELPNAQRINPGTGHIILSEFSTKYIHQSSLQNTQALALYYVFTRTYSLMHTKLVTTAVVPWYCV